MFCLFVESKISILQAVKCKLSAGGSPRDVCGQSTKCRCPYPVSIIYVCYLSRCTFPSVAADRISRCGDGLIARRRVEMPNLHIRLLFNAENHCGLQTTTVEFNISLVCYGVPILVTYLLGHTKLRFRFRSSSFFKYLIHCLTILWS